MAKIMLVTGGAGFKGSSFIKYFLKRNRNFIIVNIDRQNNPFWMNRLDELDNSPRFHHIKGDVCNRDLTDYVLRKYKPSWIVNFCGESRSLSDPKNFKANCETSFTSTLALLEAARQTWARSPAADKRFVQISTDDVYGLSESSNGINDENSPLSPENPFAAAKAGADLLTLSYSRAFGLPAVVLRCCGAYGPWQSIDRPVPSIIRKILNDEVLGCLSAETVREWIHISDLCSAITRTLFFARPGEIYNAGSGDTASEADIAGLLLKLAGKAQGNLSVPAERKKPRSVCRLNSEKARYALKWAKNYSLDEGLSDAFKWYEKHRMRIFRGDGFLGAREDDSLKL